MTLRGLYYDSEADIEKVLQDVTYKLNVRNILGIRHQEDWIYNLNIGNVMHLAAMSLDELNYPADASHELNKDAMLEKIILLCTSYFCLGTEYRFLSFPTPQSTPISEESSSTTSVKHSVTEPRFHRSESDMWHA